jgi:hypothetical protein
MFPDCLTWGWEIYNGIVFYSLFWSLFYFLSFIIFYGGGLVVSGVTCNTMSSFISLLFTTSSFRIYLAWKLYDTTRFPFNVKVYRAANKLRGNWFPESSVWQQDFNRQNQVKFLIPTLLFQAIYQVCKAKGNEGGFLCRNIWFWRFYRVARAGKAGLITVQGKISALLWTVQHLVELTWLCGWALSAISQF